MFLIKSYLLQMPISKGFIHIENRLTNSICTYYKNTQHNLPLDKQNLALCRSREVHVGVHMQLRVSSSVIFLDILTTQVKKKHSIVNPQGCGNNLEYDTSASSLRRTHNII